MLLLLHQKSRPGILQLIKGSFHRPPDSWRSIPVVFVGPINLTFRRRLHMLGSRMNQMWVRVVSDDSGFDLLGVGVVAEDFGHDFFLVLIVYLRSRFVVDAVGAIGSLMQLPRYR